MSLQPRMNFLCGLDVFGYPHRTRQEIRKVRTKPSGTFTLARPTFSKVSLSTPVSGFLMAAGLAGQTIVLHCSFSIEAVGVNESILDSWSSRCALYAARTWEASSRVSTSSACEMTYSTRKTSGMTWMRQTNNLSSYDWGTERRDRIFLYMRGCVNDGSSSSL